MDKDQIEQIYNHLLGAMDNDTEMNDYLLLAIHCPQSSYIKGNVTEKNKQLQISRQVVSLQSEISAELMAHASMVEGIIRDKPVGMYEMLDTVDNEKNVNIFRVTKRLMKFGTNVKDVNISGFSTGVAYRLTRMEGRKEVAWVNNPEDYMIGVYRWDAFNVYDNESVVFNLRHFVQQVLAGKHG